jgi:ATP-dependent DNA ligase
LLGREGDEVTLRSKSGEALARYFPELVDAARKLKAISFLLDGEIVVPRGKSFSFDDLLQRIHPQRGRRADRTHSLACRRVDPLVHGLEGMGDGLPRSRRSDGPASLKHRNY